MIHRICEFVFEHMYVTTVAVALVVGAAFVQTGKADLEASSAGWQAAHATRMSIAD